MKTFQPKDVYKILDISRQNLQYWLLLGLISQGTEGHVTGNRRSYSMQNLAELATVKYLWELFPNNSGFVKFVMDQIRNENKNAFGSGNDDPYFGENMLVIVFNDDNGYKYVYLRPQKQALEVIENQREAGHTVLFKKFDLIRMGLKRRLNALYPQE